MSKTVQGLTNCPVCTGSLHVTRMHCPQCELALEGQFSVSKLGLLPPSQQEFVELFLACGGNIKEVELALGISYPTVKKRLDEIVRALGTEIVERSRTATARDGVLQQIEAGKLSAKEGARLLREAAGKGLE